MYSSFQANNDPARIMNEKIDIYGRIVTYAKKYSPLLVGMLLDIKRANVINFKGEHTCTSNMPKK